MDRSKAEESTPDLSDTAHDDELASTCSSFNSSASVKEEQFISDSDSENVGYAP